MFWIFNRVFLRTFFLCTFFLLEATIFIQIGSIFTAWPCHPSGHFVLIRLWWYFYFMIYGGFIPVFCHFPNFEILQILKNCIKKSWKDTVSLSRQFGKRSVMSTLLKKLETCSVAHLIATSVGEVVHLPSDNSLQENTP